MSRIVEIIVRDIPGLPGELDGQLRPERMQPPATEHGTYFYGERIRLRSNPTPAHILAHVVPSLGRARSLVVDEPTVIEWASGRLGPSDDVALRNLLGSMPRPFAVAIETGAGHGTRILESKASDVFDLADPIVRGESDLGLMIINVER